MRPETTLLENSLTGRSRGIGCLVLQVFRLLLQSPLWFLLVDESWQEDSSDGIG